MTKKLPKNWKKRTDSTDELQKIVNNLEVNQMAEIIVYANEKYPNENMSIMVEKTFSNEFDIFWRYKFATSGRLVYSSDFGRRFNSIGEAKKDALKSIKPLTNGNYTLY